MKTLLGLVLASGLGLALAISPLSAETDTADTGTEAAGDKSTKADCPRGKRGKHGERGARMHNPQAMIAARLAYVSTALEITDDQKSAWEAYETAARASMEKMQETRKLMREGSAIDRMKHQLTAAEARAEALKEALPAAEELYKALSPEQQQKADRLLTWGLGVMPTRMRGHHGLHRM